MEGPTIPPHIVTEDGKNKNGGKSRFKKTKKLSFNRSASGSLLRDDESVTSVTSLIEYEKDQAVDNLDAENKIKRALSTKRKAIYEQKALNPRKLRFFKFPHIEKSEESKDFIIECLMNNVLFKEFTDKQLELLANCMKSDKFAEQMTVITQGDEGDRFYLVETGSFAMLQDGEKKGEASGGDIMGELAVFYNTEQDYTYRAITKAEVWSLDSTTFRQIIAHESKMKESDLVLDALKNVTLFKEAQLTDEQLEMLVEHVFRVKFSVGDTIIRKGSTGDVFYLIVDGYVRCTKIGKDGHGELEFGPGDYFGERSLLTNELRAANVIAVDTVECLALNRESFDKCFGSSLKELMSENMGIRMLRGFPALRELDDEYQKQFIESLDVEEFHHGDQIISQGEEAEALYIVRNGIIEKRTGKSKVVERLSSSQLFGLESLKPSAQYEHDYSAVGSVVCFALSRSAMKTLPEQIKEIFSGKQLAQHRRERYNFDDFILRGLVGEGGFGVVRIAEHRTLKKFFAIKILSKKEVVELGQQNNVFNEKEILYECDSPFILRLYKTFQDEKNLYLLTDYITGGTLLGRMDKIRGQEAPPARDITFYAACVTAALEYLRNKNIVYRDLKSENVMIDKYGYGKLIDFGFAKKISGTTNTFCGTPEYMAPEIISRRAYSFAVDMWALGILAFEMVDGVTPFFQMSHMSIYRAVKEDPPLFTDRFNKAQKQFCEGLLNKDAAKRLGTNSISEVKSQPLFRDIKWEKLARRGIDPPWVPNKALGYRRHTSEETDISEEHMTDEMRTNLDQVFMKF